ncbi:MAG: hypothetical protein HeimC3_49120 [Candidatus Heimdallarchaeota archaeon LC_3]|nr:MAG: hypothetical protein HeimC3_49120 [Candidatus Heimdallarchaeota archaeon LC_3]
MKGKNQQRGILINMPDSLFDNDESSSQNEMDRVKGNLYSIDEVFEMIENLIIKKDFRLISEIFFYIRNKFSDNNIVLLNLYYYQALKEISSYQINNAKKFINLGISKLLYVPTLDGSLKNLLNLYYIERHRCNYLQGNYKESLDYYTNLLSDNFQELQENLKLKVYSYIGEIYYDMGLFKECLENYEKALKIAMEIKSYHGIAYILNNHAKTHKSINNVDISYESYKLSLHFSEKTKNPFIITKNLLDLGILLNSQGQVLSDQYYLQKLTEHENVIGKNQLIESIIKLLKKNADFLQEIRFEDYEELLLQENCDFQTKIIVLELYLQLLLKNMKENRFDEVFVKFQNTINELETITRNNKLYPIFIKSRLLKSKYYLIDANFQKALLVLQETIEQIKGKNLDIYIKLLETEIQKINMNTILFGKITLEALQVTSFVTQHLNEFLHYLFNFTYMVSKYS